MNDPNIPRDTPPSLIDAKSAARMLAIGTRTLWSLTNRNAIPHRRIGRLVRYDPAELRAWIDAGCPSEPGSADRVRKSIEPVPRYRRR